jgi:hypothetical protein
MAPKLALHTPSSLVLVSLRKGVALVRIINYQELQSLSWLIDNKATHTLVGRFECSGELSVALGKQQHYSWDRKLTPCERLKHGIALRLLQPG